MTIKRVWHGWTTPENADTYQELLRTTVFPGIERQQIPGYRSIELLRRDLGDEVEFMTIMTFDSLESVIAFQGQNYERAHVPVEAQAVLHRWDSKSIHFEITEMRQY